MKEWEVNDELERISKEAVVAYFKPILRRLSGGTEENHVNQSQGGRSTGHDLNPGSLEYEAGALTTRPPRSIRILLKKFTVEN
jgi:hypothetical protein